MRNKGVIGLLMFFFAMSLSAQVEFGVKGGASYSTLVQKIGKSYESGSKVGFAIAGVADIPLKFITNRFSLRPEIAFMNQGGTWHSGVELDGMYYNDCWYNSLHIPINITFTFPFYDMDVSLYAGPAFDFALFGKMNSSFEGLRSTAYNMPMAELETELKSFDLAVDMGFAVEYNCFSFSVTASLGVLDKRSSIREGESPVYQNNVMFSLGYFFRKDR